MAAKDVATFPPYVPDSPAGYTALAVDPAGNLVRVPLAYFAAAAVAPTAALFGADAAGAVYAGGYTDHDYGGRTIRAGMAGVDLVARGTQLQIEFLNLGNSFTASVDGGTPATISLGSGNDFTYTTIFAGLPDAHHTVRLRNTQYFTSGTPAQTYRVTGAFPSVSYAQNFGPSHYLASTPWLPFPNDGSGTWNAGFSAWNTDCLRFRATCDSISVLAAGNLAGSVRLVVDGSPVGAAVGLTAGSNLEWTVLATGLDATAEREYAVYGLGLAVGGVMVRGGVNQAALDPRKSVVFYGDSITYGQGASSLAGYATLTAISLRRGRVNLGVPSSQVLDDGDPGTHPRPGSSAAGIASVTARAAGAGSVVILYGVNDACPAQYSYATFRADYQTMLAGIVAGMATGTKVYCLGVLDTASSYADETIRAAKNGAIAAAVAAAGNSATLYVSTDGWIVPSADLADGLHPNDAGAAKVAARLAAVMAA